jgi:hypothetical protein
MNIGIVAPIISLLFLFAQDVSPPEGDKRMTQIMEKVVTKAVDNNETKKKTFRYRKRLIEEDIDDDGGREIAKTETYLIYPSEDGLSSVEQLIEKDGEEQLDSKPEANLSSKNHGIDFMGPDMLVKYNFFPSEKPNLHIWEDPVKKNKYITLKPIDFRPKPEFLIDRNEDHVLSKMAGTFYISSDYHVWRIEAEMTDPLTAWKLGGLHALTFEMDQKKIGDIMVTDLIIVTVKWKILLLDWHKRYLYTYEGYEKAPR